MQMSEQEKLEQTKRVLAWYKIQQKIKSGKDFFYWLKVDGESFTNAGKPVGFVAYDENSESIKSFRWDNVQSMIALD